MTKHIPVHAMNDFLIIINAYGAFLKQREIVKAFEPNQKNSKNFNQELASHEYDPYDWDARESGASNGLSSYAISNLKNSFNKAFDSKKEELTESLISSEKYYKRLKHEFLEKYPDLKEAFAFTLKEHQEHLQNIKRQRYQLHKEVIGMSDRFLSFFKRASGSGDGLKLAYTRFFRVISKEYNIQYDEKEFERLEDKIDHPKSKKIVLDETEICFIVDILKQYLNVVTKADLKNGAKYINNIPNGNMSPEDKIALAEQIITKQHKRDQRLLSEYLSIEKKKEKIL